MDEWSAVSDQGLVQIEGLPKLMNDYRRLKDLEKKVAASLKELRTGDPNSEDEAYRLGIEALMGVNAVADAGSGEYVKFSPQETQRIDTERFKTKYPEVYADVLTVSVSRPLKLFKIKGATK